ncbi:MAG: serine/threonine-protein phosphatase [Erysipelotrichaceae bacterium]|nr:serine/threonine-protein phosphatase [Erysipelotrichaceae bacterium]
MRFTVSYCSQHGKNKQECEDSALIGHDVINEKEGTAELQSPCCICLCDGVGGYAGGQEASLFVTKELSTADVPHSITDIRALFTDVNSRLNERAQMTTDHKRMSTTATALFLSDDSVYVAHVGNTRLYTKHDASISQLTKDQTLYQWFTDHGLRVFANERNRDVIYGGMGGGRPKGMKPLAVEQLSESLLSSIFLLTSDGVHESLSQDEIKEILNNDASMLDKAKMLCSAALDHGSVDDRSVIIVCPEDDPK